jgi:rubrerythrin
VAANEIAFAAEKRYICRTCGYEYVGESLPKDFVCPICKRGTEEFEEIS